jgi:hypothetical protein
MDATQLEAIKERLVGRRLMNEDGVFGEVCYVLPLAEPPLVYGYLWLSVSESQPLPYWQISSMETNHSVYIKHQSVASGA